MTSDLLAHAFVSDSRYEAVAIQADELLRAVSMSEIDLVVIAADLSSDWGSGFHLAETVSRNYPETYIVMILSNPSQDTVVNAFRAGARGVFSRQQPMAEFLDCVEHVRKGFIWAGRGETNSLLEAFRSLVIPSAFSESDLPTLTARELEVVQHAAKGMTNKVIANEMRLSEHTVKNYLFRAFAKLGVSSRVELLFYLTNRGHTFEALQAESKRSDAKMK
jgi:DNA-binding NarL/FixJ family response regulator